MTTLTADPTSIIQVNPKNLKFNEALFQKMPQLNDEARELLLADIAARGVTVPVEVTPAGVVVDGHNRVRLAIEAGVEEIPAIVKSFDSDEEATAHVFAVNLQRRHLNQTDKRKLVKEFLALDPYKSNRQIADELGGAVTDKTVGAVREEAEKAGEVEKATTRKSKDGKTRSTTGSKKKSPAAAERRKIEQERTATSTIRLGLNEASKLAAKHSITVEVMLGVLSNSAKAKATLAADLEALLPIYMGLAASLGVEGYEYEAPEAEAVEPEASEASTTTEDGDAPF